ncbi:50S ribosome-binding GTPase [bacterium AH-315-I18]|nr:50S ribosome-binding GTPase [Phycisphaeraceae bacterium]MBN4060999.1 50S ribosome-binding GTPase [bacterium AH-315-I18]
MITLSLTTPSNTSGAVALIQLQGVGVQNVLAQLTCRKDWPRGQIFLADFAGIDEGLAICLREDWAQLMPHGGLRVIELLCEKCLTLGCQFRDANPREIYPEASSDFEADMLYALANAQSPAAIDLLLSQANNWQDHTFDNQQVLTDSKVLDQLCQMPSVVVVGPANVGKSTLTNRMLGYAASIVADLPGTTRDWVGGKAQLRHIAVRWMDTPGIRRSEDDVEQMAISLAEQVIQKADVLIHMTDIKHGFERVSLGDRQPDIHILNKADQLDEPTQNGLPKHVLPISATTGLGVDQLLQSILHQLGLDEIQNKTRWAFSPRLKEIVQSRDLDALAKYMQS